MNNRLEHKTRKVDGSWPYWYETSGEITQLHANRRWSTRDGVVILCGVQTHFPTAALPLRAYEPDGSSPPGKHPYYKDMLITHTKCPLNAGQLHCTRVGQGIQKPKQWILPGSVEDQGRPPGVSYNACCSFPLQPLGTRLGGSG